MSGSTKLAIDGVFAWEAFDSRGNPTVACEVRLAGGAKGCATVPSGASRGRHEAHELRDGFDRYGGLGVRRAIENVLGPLANAVRGMDANSQAEVDRELVAADGTADLRRLGANAVLAVSVGVALAAAAAADEPVYHQCKEQGEECLLPLPMVNVLSGGAHANAAIDIQDLLVIPVGAQSFSEAMEWAWRVRRGTGEVLSEHNLEISLVADEGGFGPQLRSNRRALELLEAGIRRSGLRAPDQVAIALDVAASQFYDHVTDCYWLSTERRSVGRGEWLAELAAWVADFPLVSLEDVLDEDDWNGWERATALMPGIQLLGDDLFVTNPERLARGIRSGVANAVLVKPNQIGTLSGAREVIELARGSGYATVLSARSGDTEDAWLADLAVAWRTGQIKVGSLTRSERTAKWNRLLRIEAELGSRAIFAGGEILRRYD